MKTHELNKIADSSAGKIQAVFWKMSFSIEKSANYTDTSFSSFSSVSLHLNFGTVPRLRSDRFLLNLWNSSYTNHSAIDSIPHTLIEWGRCQTKHKHTHPLSHINFTKLLTLLNSTCCTANFRKKSASTEFCRGRKWCMLIGLTLISVIPIAFDNRALHKSKRGSMMSVALTWNKHKNYTYFCG
jgi:hypothetical protein